MLGSEGENKRTFENTSTEYAAVKSAIEEGVDLFFKSDINTYLQELNFDTKDENFIKIAKEIVYAAACAVTGEKEYSNKEKSENWYPANDYFGTIPGLEQDASGKTLAHNLDEVADKATEFGLFKIKQYTKDKFIRACW